MGGGFCWAGLWRLELERLHSVPGIHDRDLPGVWFRPGRITGGGRRAARPGAAPETAPGVLVPTIHRRRTICLLWRVRMACQVREPLPCAQCNALCCRYMAIKVDTPRTADDYDDVRWYLLHRDVRVLVDTDGTTPAVSYPFDFRAALISDSSSPVNGVPSILPLFYSFFPFRLP